MRSTILLISIAVLVQLLPGCQMGRELTKSGAGDMAFQHMAPARGYLKAHQTVQEPFDLLGGPIMVRITQQTGGVHVALPDYRKLDENVFGIPQLPLCYGGSPIVYGVAPSMRGVENGTYTRVQQKSPFGDKHLVFSEGELMLEAIDVTATDAATTKDNVLFEAGWRDDQGNTYKVRCSKVMPHGVEYPVFGGVATNHLLHGFTRIGSPLMPTEYGYLAFWGTGDVLKNGMVTDSQVVVHGMLTEYVRKENYELAFDEDVTPTRRHFHVLVPPVVPSGNSFKSRPVKTGFMLDDGSELPFWHVMFANLTIEATRDIMDQVGMHSMSYHSAENDGSDSLNNANTDTADTVIRMTDALQYVPQRVTIQENETVKWVNTSNLMHTVTADSQKALNPQDVMLPGGAKPFDSGSIPPGESFTYTFTVPGTYRYFCIPHEAAGMVGEIIVKSKR